MVLHEYRILENELADAGVGQAALLLLKLFKKSGLGPKNGAQYGAPFNEEEWDADDADEDEICAETPQQSKIFPFPVVANTTGSVLPSENMPPSDVAHNNSNSFINGQFFQGVPPIGPLPGPGPSTTMSLANDVAPPVGEVDLESLLVMLTEDPPIPSNANDVNQVNGEFMELDDVYGGLENLTDWEELWHWDQSYSSDSVYHC